MPFWRTCAYPYSSERERHRSHARSWSVVSFSQGAEGQITESWVIRSVSFGMGLSYSIGGGILCPPCATLEFGHHFGDRFGIDLKVIPAAPVWGLSGSTLPQQRQKVSIGAALASGSIETLVILNPEGNVPGLPVCPTVVGFGLGSGGGRHRVGFVWFLSILQHGRGHPCPPLCQLPDCHHTMGVPSLSVTVPASLSAAIESKICRSSSPLTARFSRAEASSKVMIKC